jgi:hypothetical protein
MTTFRYVWGAENNMKSINLNGKAFPVTKTLWGFLIVASALRTDRMDRAEGLNTTTHSLWIDALCINQADTKEKNHQVQQMGQIYLKAKLVIAWFGDDPRIARVLKFARETHCSGAVPSILAEYLENILCFRNDRYWTRAWITQKVCLANRLHLLANKELVALDILQEIGDHILSKHGPAKYNLFWRPIQDIQNRSNTYSLLGNLWRFRNKKCKDLRDMVYSLLYISEINRLAISQFSQLSVQIWPKSGSTSDLYWPD